METNINLDLNTLKYISYGMYIVSSSKDGALNGQIANTLIQVTNDPVTMAISINKQTLTHNYIESSNMFTVSVLKKETPLRFIGRFGFKSGRSEDKFSGIAYEMLENGCPAVLDNAICYLSFKVVNKMDCGTYTLFLGELVESKMLQDAKPMTYEYYHLEKCGATPESAPTFVQNEEKSIKCDDAQKYRCTVCNYIYNPVLGDPDGGIAPGTKFEDIPDDWVCPICGVDKSKFVKMEG